MKLRQVMITSVIGASALAASMAYAAPSSDTTDRSKSEYQQQMKHKAKFLTEAEKEKLKPIMQSLRSDMIPLKQQEKVLKTQLKGKIATEGTKLADVQPLINQINDLQKQMSTLKVKAQLQAFDEVGVMLPNKGKMKHGKHKKK